MIIVVAGSRTFKDYELLRDVLNRVFKGETRKEVLHGGAVGADTLAERYCVEQGILSVVYRPDYRKFPERPRYAPIARNERMIDAAPDMLVAFWDGRSRGTKHIIEYARSKGVKVEVIGF